MDFEIRVLHLDFIDPKLMHDIVNKKAQKFKQAII